MFQKLQAFTKKVSDFADQPSGSPAEIKAQFDAAPEELRQYFNSLVDALKLTTAGDSGAKNTGATAISGLTGTDVQTLLESLKSYGDTNLNNNTYLFVNCATAQNYASANTWQACTFADSDCVHTSDITIANGTITVNTDGVYKFNTSVEFSGLNSGVFCNCLIRVIPPAGKGAAYDFAKNRVGGSGYGGNNGGVWLDLSKIDKLYAGTQIYFMVNVGEAPRTIMHVRSEVNKIAKL